MSVTCVLSIISVVGSKKNEGIEQLQLQIVPRAHELIQLNSHNGAIGARRFRVQEVIHLVEPGTFSNDQTVELLVTPE